jgi:hypothetical protein
MTDINFALLRTRLINRVNYKIRNGEYSERALARMIGISQSQLHNVLKGCRTLSYDLGDRFLRHFGMDLLDLLEAGERTPGAEQSAEGFDLVKKGPQPDLGTEVRAKRRAS